MNKQKKETRRQIMQDKKFFFNPLIPQREDLASRKTEQNKTKLSAI